MTEANGSVDPGARPGWRWDVALSFAGAQRGYVEQVAQALQARGVRCFYDAAEVIDLWGKSLAEELSAIYGEQAAVVVIFVSAEYAARDWTRHERRAAMGRAVRERREYMLPARFDDTVLPGLAPDVSYVDLPGRTPQEFAAMIAAKLASLGIGPSSSPGEAGRGPPGGILVSEADPRRLGVHAAISVPGVRDEVPPEYVPRDADASEHGVRARVAAAAERGGFVLLVGGSSVGKTRCAVEAVKARLPEWWLVQPAGPGEVAAFARTPTARTVVWLDELQRYLDGEDGLTGGVVRVLLNAPYPVVIIGTLWPDRYAAYTALPAPGGADLWAREREVLDLAAVIRIGPEFSKAEQDRARAAAARDRRLRVAMETAGYGLTQTLAAAPQLVARWQDAQTASPYGWAVLTAALDAARIGAAAPLSAEFLRVGAPGYLTSQQQARAPGNWLEQALAYATEELHGAAAALSPAAAGMGQIAGYTAADYLIQHASKERHCARVPASTWDAALSHIRDPADAGRLADSARNRLLYHYAIPMYRHCAEANDRHAARRLAELLAKQGDLDGAAQILRGPADAGDGYAAARLAARLAGRGDLDGAAQVLRGPADAGDGYAAMRLAERLAGRGDLDGLRARADAGDSFSAVWLAELLAKQGDLDGLRARADAGDDVAAERLTELLAKQGDLDEAVQTLRARADAGNRDAAERLTELLAKQGDLDEAVQTLRARADAGDWWAPGLLADLLAKQGDLDGLRARADADDGDAAMRLADLLAERGDLDGLRARAEAGDWWAPGLLANLLAKQGDLDRAIQVLRTLADAYDAAAASQLAELLAERGDLDGAMQILRTWADAGTRGAAERLAELLAERGDLDGLRARADAGDDVAAERLADLLAKRGDLDGLRARADAGDDVAARRLARLLAKCGDLDGLRARADAGEEVAAERLAHLMADRLMRQGQGEEAERLRRFGLNPDGSIARA
jgi:hypothetical protein